MWPRLKKVLTTDESVVQFIGYIVTASGVAHQQRAEWLMIFNAVQDAADGLTVSASVPDLVPQPLDSGDANSEEPAVEIIIPTTAIEQVVGDGESFAGAVV